MSHSSATSLTGRTIAERRSLESFKAAFIGRGPQVLQNKLLQRVRTRKRVDREIEVAQVPGATFVTARVEQLRQNPDADYLTELYGIRTARRRLDIDEQAGLRQSNVNSANYQRGMLSLEFKQLCTKLYESRQPPGSLETEAHGLFLTYAHSAAAVELMREQIRARRKENGLKITAHGLSTTEREALEEENSLLLAAEEAAKAATYVAPGLLAFACPDDKIMREIEDLLNHLGGVPSNYQVVKHLMSKRPAPEGATLPIELTDVRPDINNAALLRDIVSGMQIRSDRLKLPAAHPARPVMQAGQSLINGLEPALSNALGAQTPRQSTLLNQSLRMLRSLSESMSTMAGEPERLSSVYQVVLDELFVLLAATRPYGLKDFDAAAIGVLKTRVGEELLADMDLVHPEAFLVSSGMEAIATGIQAAKLASSTEKIDFLSDRPHDRLPDYFEVLGLFPATESRDNRIFTAIQNPSSPRLGKDGDGGWDVQKLVELLGQRALADATSEDNPVVIVLDATVEKAAGQNGHSDLRHVVESLKDPIAEGRLRLILCKSYQKFPSLSSGKIMGGSVVVLSKDDQWLERAHEYLRGYRDGVNWAENDETQLLTHFLRHGHESELELLSHAAQNADFVGQFCFPDQAKGKAGFDRYQPELPFAMISNVDIGLAATVTGLAGTPADDLAGLLAALVEGRNSFGFLETTSAFFDFEEVPSARLSFGQESREELVERLYAVGQLHARRLGRKDSTEDGTRLPIDPITLKDVTKQIAAKAAQQAMLHAQLSSWADQAIQIIERRANDHNDLQLKETAKQLQEEVNETLRVRRIGFDIEDASGQALRAEEPEVRQLRQNLKSALDRTTLDEGSALTDHLMIIGGALAPEVPAKLRAGSDIDAMRVNLPVFGARGLEQPSDETRYAPNMIVSLLDLAGRVRGSEAEAIRLHEAVLASGMRGVSAAGRTRTVLAWARLATNSEIASLPEYGVLRTAEGQPAPLVAPMIRNARLISYPEDKVRLFKQIPSLIFSSLNPEDQDELTRSLFLPSNLDARPGVVADLAQQSADLAKVSSCLRVARAEYRAGIQKNQSERIAGDAAGSSDGLLPIVQNEADNYRQALLLALVPKRDWIGFRARVSSWAPEICKLADPASTAEDSLIELARLAEFIYETSTTRRIKTPDSLDDDADTDAPPLERMGILVAGLPESLRPLGNAIKNNIEALFDDEMVFTPRHLIR